MVIKNGSVFSAVVKLMIQNDAFNTFLNVFWERASHYVNFNTLLLVASVMDQIGICY